LAGSPGPNKSVKGTRRPLAILKFCFYQSSVASLKLSERRAPYRNVRAKPTMRELMKTILSFVLMLSFGSALACQSNESDCLINKNDWSNLFSTVLPAALCKEDSPILQCYEVTQAKCLEISLAVTQQCIKDTAIPDSFKKSESKKWGGIVGSCAGDKLTNQLQLKKGKSEDCAIQQ
jgi:hypothetical protein